MQSPYPGTVQQTTTDRTLVHTWLAGSGLSSSRAYTLRRAAGRDPGVPQIAVPFLHRLTWYPGRVLDGRWEPAHYIAELPPTGPAAEAPAFPCDAIFFYAPPDEAVLAQVAGYAKALYDDGDAAPAPEVIDRLYDFAWYLKHGTLQ